MSKYCKGNSSAVEYPLELKLIGLHIEDVSFTTIKRSVIWRGPLGHLRVCFRHLKRGLKYSFEFGNSSGGVGYRGPLLGTRKRPEVSIGALLCLRTYAKNTVTPTELGKLPSIEYASRRPYALRGYAGKLAKSGSTELKNIDEDVHCE
ncbi:hypothetical protein Adt_11733 [Abeliophyllum distichum]|uniref:Uncharacterized protein n=1 Tax=Abeliophyllum distichum TaxID=126358 RepID=A0ABD1UNQ1_9LAMI